MIQREGDPLPLAYFKDKVDALIGADLKRRKLQQASLLSGKMAEEGAPYDKNEPLAKEPTLAPMPDNKGNEKLVKAVLKCHAKMAYGFYTGRDFDEEACEEFDPLTHRGARDRYSLRVAKLLAHGGCPSCLDGVQQEALALGTVGQMDSDNGRLYPCP